MSTSFPNTRFCAVRDSNQRGLTHRVLGWMGIVRQETTKAHRADEAGREPVDGREAEVDLLALLDAFYHADKLPSGFEATICIGVVAQEGATRWWRADCGTIRRSAITDERPSADFTMLLGQDDAIAFLHTGKVSSRPTCCKVAGDRSLFRRFVKRHLGGTTMLSLRTIMAKGTKKSPRRNVARRTT